MSRVLEALDKLENAVSTLESSMNVLDDKLAGCQRDMFENPNVVKLDRKKVVERLDNTIERVENLLKDEA